MHIYVYLDNRLLNVFWYYPNFNFFFYCLFDSSCFQEEAVVNNSVLISTSIPHSSDHASCLILPPQITRISISSKDIFTPSLFELCLRYLWNGNQKGSGSSATKKFSCLSNETVPPNIHSLLQIGPVTYCSYVKCNAPIFTCCSVVVIKVSVTHRVAVRGNIVPGILYFCCDVCSNHYLHHMKSMRDTFSLWLTRQLEQACTVRFL